MTLARRISKQETELFYETTSEVNVPAINGSGNKLVLKEWDIINSNGFEFPCGFWIQGLIKTNEIGVGLIIISLVQSIDGTNWNSVGDPIEATVNTLNNTFTEVKVLAPIETLNVIDPTSLYLGVVAYNNNDTLIGTIKNFKVVFNSILPNSVTIR